MSGSPKYTVVDLDAARRAEVEAARRRREEERRRRREEARRRRLDAGVRATTTRRDALVNRLRQLAETARTLPQHAEVIAELSRAVALAPPVDEPGVTVVGRQLRRVERRVDALVTAVAAALSRQERARAVDLALEPLSGLADGERLDPTGHRSVAALRDQARRHHGDDRSFGKIHEQLRGAVVAHVATVRDRQGQLLRMAAESDELATRLEAVLADAEAARVPVTGAAELRAEVSELRARSGDGSVTRWEQRAAELRRHVEAVTADVDAHLDRMERMAIIVEAASTALPAAGLRVVPDSLTERDDAVIFVAERADGSAIELTVHSDDGDGNRLEYRVDGADTVVETSVDGTTSRCDLTEELLERFHTELGRQGVAAHGLHWAGKPAEPRPPARQALANPAHQLRERA
ncbi:hypothetical protein [Micromonospora globbae]|jgi:hypothetical protein|uniref:Uncharacterized protein n=1 Tax=Micromonospora globbae TaxID=1894969 RepID=A0ABZ1S8H3_9ACTN|nr:hypothetical protein [Micromonospora globbae]